MAKDVSLPKCNLYLVGVGKDTNGNRVVKLKFPNSRAFSIQITSNSMDNTATILRGLKTVKDFEEIKKTDLQKIANETCAHIKKYGSENQKKQLRVYKS